MNVKEMDKLTKHFDQCFEQTDCMVLHPVVDAGFHIDILLYKPTQKYPFWKLATMGASDYKMPKIANTIGACNEYIMFVDGNEDLQNKEIAFWYYNKLILIASYAYTNKTHITYGHSLEWENEDPDDEMIAAFIEFPQAIENANILHCRTGLLKKVACLQVVLLNNKDLDNLKEIGPQAFSQYLYPENDERPHFLSQKHRNEKF